MGFNKLILSLKGGSGSGNHGHSGIPGKVGGSTPGSSGTSLTSTPERVALLNSAKKLKKVAGVESFEVVGSFVSDKPVPGDIDIIAKVQSGHDPFEVERNFWLKNEKLDKVNVFFLADGINELTGTNTYKWMVDNTKKRYNASPYILS